MTEVESCSCESCCSACTCKPGWFNPGEAEKAADLLGVPLEELFKTRLAVDWWTNDYDETFLLSPSVKGGTPGEEFGEDPRGECVFYEDGKCSIYDARPHECREYMHGDSKEVVADRHEAIAQRWKDHQAEIEDLLGEPPYAEPFCGGGILGMLGLVGKDW